MNPIAAAFLVGAMIVIRRWSQGEQIVIDNVLGIAGVALGLAVIGSIDKQLGRAFGLLVVVSVALFQLPPLLEDAGKRKITGQAPRARGGAQVV